MGAEARERGDIPESLGPCAPCIPPTHSSGSLGKGSLRGPFLVSVQERWALPLVPHRAKGKWCDNKIWQVDGRTSRSCPWTTL